jgi:alpha-tubulin suppressor-like RCC1 family protein
VALAAALGCNNTLFDARGVPALGPLVCQAPGTHACEALRLCARDDDADLCEAGCHPCATEVANAHAICSRNACTYECAPGLLKCAQGCCTAAVVSAGVDHACAITAETRELLCWGANNDGQLGAGDALGGIDQPRPTPVPLPGPVRSVSGGAAHSCAVLEDGRTFCWGRESSFIGGAEYLYQPAEVRRLAGATTVATGGGHTCATLAGGAVRCVGAWNPGGVPDPPVAAGATALAAGDDFSCAIVAGAIQCWGANDHEQLAAPGEVAQPAFIPVPGRASALALGIHHACAITADFPPVRCWSVRVGLSSDASRVYRLDLVQFPVLALTAGEAHTCALRDPAADGVACWGNPDAPATLGGPPSQPSAPVAVPLPGPVRAVAAGGNHTCAIDANGAVRCWGAGGRGQLGDGRRSTSAAPVGVVSR